MPEDITQIEGQEMRVDVTPDSTAAEVNAASNGALETAQQMVGALRSAVETNKATAESIERLMTGFTETMGTVNEAIAGLQGQARRDDQAERELEASELIDAARSATNADDRNRLNAQAAQLIGFQQAQRFMEGGYRRVLASTPSAKVQGAASAQYLRELQEVSDNVTAMLATNSALTSSVPGGDGYQAGRVTVHSERAERVFQKVEESVDAGYLNPLYRVAVNAMREEMRTGATTTGVGTGYETLPRPLSASFIDEVDDALAVASLFPRYTMTTRTLRLPAVRGGAAVYRTTESGAMARVFQSAVQDSTIPTGDITFEAESFAALVLSSFEFEEDTILNWPAIQLQKLGRALAEAREDAIINGSVNLTDHDNAGGDGNRWWSNTTASGIKLATGDLDPRNAMDGLRKMAIAKSYTLDCGNDATKILKGIKNLHSRGQANFGGQRGRWVAAMPFALEAIATFSDANFMTLDKIGPRATVLTGQIGTAYGIPIIISDKVPSVLNATGVFDDSSSKPFDRGAVLLIHRDAFGIGNRVEPEIFRGDNALGLISYMFVRTRWDFQELYTSAHKTVGTLYNVPTSVAL